ncbi:hypothetical protein PFNF54_01989 [Plasmodium falciparum NF54]|uniref:Erythrocyte membrane protein 1 n=1 Tax=Plasmodium falciparum (isolate NF54) TaxID=5843 RepID=W7KI40_PLAFO|nr:hypothetical protein PFNF54_01989 [Plasmodium falciparum NF54]
MAAAGGGGKDKYKNAQDAKHLLDIIGEDIYKIANDAALKRSGSELKGLLSLAKFEKNPPDKQTPEDPCDLDYKYHTNVTSNVIEPCNKRSGKRFSEVSGAECANNRIKGNKGSNGDACAPFRRLHVCDRNLEQIDPAKITATHNLLVDVCQAAKFEGQSITQDYPKYLATYNDSPSQICTMLARSFADIGDIVRGKDLFRGYDDEEKNRRKKLEQKLKVIFGHIYEELKKHKKLKEEAEERYKKDGDNYYKLREDWWALNRQEIWKAITCGHPGGTYFRQTACGGGTTPTPNKCRCATNDVPTYFDYVPQYLRWFEEWAEDFCRKRKYKLENAIEKCRGKTKGEKYCDLNGFDCTQTASGEKKFVKGHNCHNCSVTCIPFGPWIDNQKKEFLKQRNKYQNEISSNSRKKRSTSNNNYKGYDEEFYKILKEDYGDVEQFLEKLSREGICQSQPTVGNQKADAANFTKDNPAKTFSHTEYCQACPWCGVVCKSGNCTKNPEGSCTEQIRKKVYDDSNTTTIPVLTPEKGKTSILQKYKTFCEKPEKHNQINNWECHYEKTDISNNCILGKWEKFQKGQEVMVYHPFFWKWVTEMLDDSIKWRKELDNCLKNENKQCISKCNGKCDCYKRWVEQKKEKEWTQIKDHFGKQEDMKEQIRGADPGIILEGVLDIEDLFENIKDTYGDVKEIDHIKKLLEEETTVDADNQNKTTIDKLLDHEDKDAKGCLQKQNECKEQERDGGARSDSQEPTPRSEVKPDSEDLDDDDEDDPDEEKSEEVENPEDQGEEEGTKQGSGEKKVDGTEAVQETVAEVTPEKKDEVNPCEIVKTLFEKPENLSDACGLKYGPGGKERYSQWKCIPTKPNSDNKGEVGSAGRVARSAPSGEKGSICVPPRRRRLYVKDLETLGDSEVTQVQLRDAFIKCAAVETFFLWDRYKKEKEKKKPQEGVLQLLGTVGTPPTDDEEDPPEKMLQKGEIPEEFKRQMFYTLADYKDILFGDQEVIKTLKDSGDENIKDISEKIKKTLNGDNNQESGSSPSLSGKKTTPKDWWETYGKDIWEGMVCALTYKNSGDKKIEQVKTADDGEDLFQKLKTQYEYNTVTLKDENSGTEGAKPFTPKTVSSSSGEKNPPKLSDFVLRPPYFRYLEEWGETFCRQRARMLDKIKKDCNVEENDNRPGGGITKQYSGDGESCKDYLPDDPTTLPDLVSSCPKSCSSYRKWINKKKDEFVEQQNAYTEQQNKCQSKSDKAKSDNGFYTRLQNLPDAAAFLKTLGSCSKNDIPEYKIDFDVNGETFRYEKYCGTCPEFKINCTKVKCTSGDMQNGCKDNKINAANFKTMAQSTEINMLVSDNSGNGSQNDLKDCKTSGIFKGFREDVWTCGKVCGYNVCKPKNVNGQNGDGNQILLFNALLKRWVEYFLEDYKKIKHKISHCKNSSEGHTCIKNCVEQWISTKRTEWETIRGRFNDQYKSNDSDVYPVRSFLETWIPKIPVANANNDGKKLIKLSKFDNFCSCSASAHSPNGKDDAIDCMINRLQDKIDKCKEKHPQPSAENQTTCDESTLVEDVDDYEEQNPENKVGKPAICGNVDTTEPVKEEDEEECKAAESPAEPEQAAEEESVPAAETKDTENQPPQAPDLLR